MALLMSVRRPYAVVQMAIFLAACGVTPRNEGKYSSEMRDVSDGECENDAERKCSRTLKSSSGVALCYHGTQKCSDGQWGECVDGEEELLALPSHTQSEAGPSRSTASLSTAAACVNNPCDPECQYFLEDPGVLIASPPLPPDFPGLPATTKCAHNVCAWGASLALGCDPCVDQVCAAAPSCCTGTWDAQCTALAWNLCGGIREPRGLCDLGLYSNSTITLGNRGSVDALLGAYGDISIGTDSNFLGVQSAGNISYPSLNNRNVSAPWGIVADGNISFAASNSFVSGNVEAGGSVSLGNGIKFTGNGSARGNLAGQAGSQIQGNATAGGTVTGISVAGVKTNGSAHTYYPVQLPPKTGGNAIPILATTCTGGSDVSASGLPAVTLTPGVYGNVNITNGGRLILKGKGTYYFKSLRVSDRVELDPGGALNGTWKVRVCGDVVFADRTQIVGPNLPASKLDAVGIVNDPTLLQLYTETLNPVSMGTDVYFTGILMAPFATVKKGNTNNPPTESDVRSGTRSAPVHGAIWANTIDLGTDALVSSISRSACNGLGIPGSGSVPCPVNNDVPAVPSARREPCQTRADCQIDSTCTNVATGGACAHSKCVTGGALAPGCDACVASVCATMPSCCGVAWGAACVAAVATECGSQCGASGAGECRSNTLGSTTPGCTGVDLTLAVPCDDVVTVCNRGTLPYSGDVDVDVFPMTSRQMSVFPPTAVAAQTCTGTVNLDSGKCAEIACPGAAGTLVVNPKNLVAECANENNWTVHDGRECPTVATVLTETYEAVCPASTSPVWTFLTWNASTPGTSKVKFSGRAGNSSSELAAATYIVLGTAAKVAPGIEVCTLSGPSPQCPLDLPKSFSWSGQHPKLIELKLELSSGAAVPSVDEWKVYYSCKYSQ